MFFKFKDSMSALRSRSSPPHTTGLGVYCGQYLLQRRMQKFGYKPTAQWWASGCKIGQKGYGMKQSRIKPS